MKLTDDIFLMYQWRIQKDEITCIARAEFDELNGTVGDGIFRVSAGGELFGIPYSEIKEQLEKNGVIQRRNELFGNSE